MFPFSLFEFSLAAPRQKARLSTAGLYGSVALNPTSGNESYPHTYPFPALRLPLSLPSRSLTAGVVSTATT